MSEKLYILSLKPQLLSYNKYTPSCQCFIYLVSTKRTAHMLFNFMFFYVEVVSHCALVHSKDSSDASHESL